MAVFIGDRARGKVSQKRKMFLAYFLPCIRRTNWIQVLNGRGIEGEGERCILSNRGYLLLLLLLNLSTRFNYFANYRLKTRFT